MASPRPTVAAAAIAAPGGSRCASARQLWCLVLLCAATAVAASSTTARHEETVEVLPAGATMARVCATVSHEFRRLADAEQRRLAERSALAVPRQKILIIGGFGGSGTRAWASLFHSFAPDIQFVRGNPDWDSGHVAAHFHNVFPPCRKHGAGEDAAKPAVTSETNRGRDEGGLREYFDFDNVFRHMEQHPVMEFFDQWTAPAVAEKWNITLGDHAPAWGLKQPDAIALIPGAITHTQHVVGLVVARDPRDLATRPYMHSTPDGMHLGSHSNLCATVYGHLECDWHKVDIASMSKEERKVFFTRKQTPACITHSIDAWAATYGFIRNLAVRNCERTKRPVQQLFLGRSEDLLDPAQVGAVVGLVQHVLASLGVARSGADIEAALAGNLQRGRNSSYGRWRQQADKFTGGDWMRETRGVVGTMGYRVPPAGAPPPPLSQS